MDDYDDLLPETPTSSQPFRGGSDPSSGSQAPPAALPTDADNRLGKTGTTFQQTQALDTSRTTANPDKSKEVDDGPASWLSLPRKDQLSILTIIRLAEPITQTSITAYMFFMLKNFDPGLTDAEISRQAGMLAASFTAAQAVTGMIWGRLADKAWIGRKRVLAIGLTGTLLATLGFAFSTSFIWALCFRTLGGVLNGNVGVMRTMVSEIIVEKRFQPKAFLLMPLTFNVGVLVGPVLGGFLQSPSAQYPHLFGPGSPMYAPWLVKYPYALPNLVTSAFLFCALLLVIFGLEETHRQRRHRRDRPLELGRTLGRFFLRLRHPNSARYTHLSTSSQDSTTTVELASASTSASPMESEPEKPLRVFTRNVCITLLNHALFSGHLVTFNALWFIFLSTPRGPAPLRGGLAFDPVTLGFAIAVIGVLGLALQFGVYASVTHRLGVLRTFRTSALLFPVVYALVPLLVFVAGGEAAGAGAPPWHIWPAIGGILFVYVVGRTFALPTSQILVNNCAPSPAVLGTIHGAGVSLSAGAKTVGPVVFSTLYAAGLKMGNVGVAWWCLAVEAGIVIVVSRWVRDGGS